MLCDHYSKVLSIATRCWLMDQFSFTLRREYQKVQKDNWMHHAVIGSVQTLFQRLFVVFWKEHFFGHKPSSFLLPWPRPIALFEDKTVSNCFTNCLFSVFSPSVIASISLQHTHTYCTYRHIYTADFLSTQRPACSDKQISTNQWLVIRSPFLSFFVHYKRCWCQDGAWN